MVVELVEGLHINMSSFTYVRLHLWLWSLLKGCILIFQVSPKIVELVERLHVRFHFRLCSLSKGCIMICQVSPLIVELGEQKPLT